MARDTRTHIDDERPESAGRPARRRYARVAVPVGVLAVGALTAGLVPALAASGDPTLPHISAQALLEKVAASKTDTFSGTVKSSVDLGLPAIPGNLGGALGGSGSGSGAPGGSAAPGGRGAAGNASPQGRLMELASGSHTLRVAADGPEKQSAALQEKLAEYRVVHNGATTYAYDSRSNTVWHRTLTAAERKRQAAEEAKTPSDAASMTPKNVADRLLKAAGPSTDVSVDGTSRVAGRSAYDLVLKPKSSGSTVGSVRISVDAKTWVPLKVVVTTRAGGAPAVDVGFSSVSFARPAASEFTFKTPAGAKTVDGNKPLPGARPGVNKHLDRGAEPSDGKPSDGKTFGSGWSTVVRVSGGSDALTAEPGAKKGGPDLKGILGELGTRVTDDFGSGTVVKSRLVNALVTDSGKVYAGAVSTGDLIKAANSDK